MAPVRVGDRDRAGAAGPFADGVRLQLTGHGEVIDGMSSWWAALHGYRHPVLDAAAHAQLESTSQVMFSGLTHAPAVGLVQRLLAITPEPLRHVFLCDSGSVSVEVPMKMALQHAIGRGEPLRRLVRGGHHGDTFGAMSACDPVSGMHSLFNGVLPEQVFAPRPPAGFDAGPGPELDAWSLETTRLFEQHAAELAAVIVEPVLQGGAGGMHVYSPECLRVPRALCDEHGVLLVFDEIAGAPDPDGAAAGASPAAELSRVPDVRGLGAVGVVQTRGPVDPARAMEAALATTVWLRPFRDLVYTTPPYVSTDDDDETITRGVLAAVTAGA
jgi:adenosylmethionine-8-amino-7-oxononanoate aminotransferase